MEISKLFGLPAHPLVVHVPVVLIPLVVVGLVVLVVKPGLRRTLGWFVLGTSALTLVFIQLSMGSGEELEEAVRESDLVEQHAQLAEQLRPIALLLFVAIAVVVIGDWWIRRRSTSEAESGPISEGTRRAGLVLNIVTVVALILGGLSTIWVVRVGHVGAEATWSDTARKMETGEHDEREENEREEDERRERRDREDGERSEGVRGGRDSTERSGER